MRKRFEIRSCSRKNPQIFSILGRLSLFCNFWSFLNSIPRYVNAKMSFFLTLCKTAFFCSSIYFRMITFQFNEKFWIFLFSNNSITKNFSFNWEVIVRKMSGLRTKAVLLKCLLQQNIFSAKNIKKYFWKSQKAKNSQKVVSFSRLTVIKITPSFW